MHRVSRFSPPALPALLAILALLPAGCAASGTERRLSRLEGQAEHQHVLDMRISHVEERLGEMEKAVGELRRNEDGAKGAGRPPASSRNVGRKAAPVSDPPAPELRISLPSAAPVPALSRSSEAAPAAPTLSRSSEAAPAAPRETGVVLAYPPAAPAPSPNLTLAKARGIDPLRAPASPGAEPFSGPAPRPLAPVAAKASSPTPAASAPPPPALTASSALSAPSLGATGFPGFQAGPKLDPPGPGKTESRKPAAGSSSSGGGSAGSPKKPGYDEALSLYHKGEYARAGESFDSFLRSAPGSALTPNALYWQGECLYSLGRYDDAIMLFKDVAARYPRHDKAAASLLKAGYSYERLKDLENARFYWQILIDDFPASSPAALARKRMAG